MRSAIGDVYAEGSDPSGSVKCAFHREVAADERVPVALGFMFVLKNPVYFQPYQHCGYLCIKKANIFDIGPPVTSLCTQRKLTDTSSWCVQRQPDTRELATHGLQLL